MPYKWMILNLKTAMNQCSINKPQMQTFMKEIEPLPRNNRDVMAD
jgi:hypothetical protein